MAEKTKKQLDDEELAKKVMAIVERERTIRANPKVDQQAADERRQYGGSLDANEAFLPGAKPAATGVQVEAQEPTDVQRTAIVKGVDVEAQPPTSMVTVHEADSPEAKAAAQDAREGMVYLQNTEADGTKTRGAMIARKMFASDEDFDKFVSRAKEQDNLWNPESERASGGGFFSRVRKAGNALFGPQALPSGAGGGSDDGSSMPERRGGNVGSVQRIDSGAGGGAGGGNGGNGGYQGGTGVDALPERRGGNVGAAAPLEESYMFANGPAARPPGFFSSGAGGGGGSNPPADQPVSGPSGVQMLGEPTLPMANGGNNALSVPGYALGSLFGGNAPPTNPSGQPPAAMQAPAPGPGPGGTSNGSRASMAMRGAMMNAAPVRQAPNYDDEMANAASLAQQAIGHSADIDSARERANTQVYQTQQDEQAKIAQRLQGRTEYVDAGQKAMMDTIAKAQETLNSPAKTPDPERYWKNHSKIMFAIGVGLLAQAGKDINGVLNNVNSAIDRDIESQKAEFEAPRAAARGQIAAASQMYGMFRDQGHDAYEASKMASIVLKDRTATDLAKVMANSNSEMAQTNGQKMQAQLQEGLAKDLNDLSQHRQTNNIAEYNAQTNRMEAQVKVADEQRKMAGSAGGGKIIPEGGVNAISKLKTAISSLDALSENFNRVGGNVGDALVNNVRQQIPRTEATNYNKMRDAFMRTVALLVDESVVQQHDAKAWEKLLPLSNDLNGMSNLRALRQSVQMKLDDRVKTFGEAGYNVSRLSSPTPGGGGGRYVRLPSGEVVERAD